MAGWTSTTEFLKGLAATPQQPSVEPLWSFRLNGRTISCVLRHHGKRFGVEAQIVSDGDLRIGRRFDTKDWPRSGGA